MSEIDNIKKSITDEAETYYTAAPFRGNRDMILSKIIAGGAGLDALKAKIVKAGTDKQAVISAVDKLADVDLERKFKTDNDERMKVFINSYVSGLTEDQKLDLARIMQRL